MIGPLRILREMARGANLAYTHTHLGSKYFRAGGDPCAFMVSSGAGGDASQSDQNDVSRMKVFRDRSAQDDQTEKGDVRHDPLACVVKGIPIREAKHIPKAQAALDSELNRRVFDGVRRRTKRGACQWVNGTCRTHVSALHGQTQ